MNLKDLPKIDAEIKTFLNGIKEKYNTSYEEQPEQEAKVCPGCEFNQLVEYIFTEVKTIANLIEDEKYKSAMYVLGALRQKLYSIKDEE